VSEVSSTWRRIGAWEGVALPGRIGEAEPAGVIVTSRHDLALAYVIASEKDQAATVEVFARNFGLELPMKPSATGGDELTMVWAGPSQWLAVSRKPGVAGRLSDALKGLAAVSDQSDGRAVLMLEGAHVREMLTKGCPVDLHPRSFSRGDAIVTAMAGIGVQLWQMPESDAFHVAIARSMAGSFWSWLTHSAAEFGVEVRQSIEP
jgi:methylglutamate dehydrogenase subunit D